MNIHLLIEPSSYKRRLYLFLILSIIHFLLLFLIYFDIKFSFLIIIEIIFYFYFNNLLVIPLLKTILIGIFIFILNFLFYDGKIILSFDYARITYDGVYNSLTKTFLLIATVLFTLNILKDNSFFIINKVIKNKNNLIALSVRYFFIFFQDIVTSKKIDNLFNKIIIYYKKDIFKVPVNNNYDNNIKIDLFIYHFIFIISFFILIILKYCHLI